MICKIVHYSEDEFNESVVLQIQDDLVVGENLYINQQHTLTIEHVIQKGNDITILDGSKILKLKLA